MRFVTSAVLVVIISASCASLSSAFVVPDRSRPIHRVSFRPISPSQNTRYFRPAHALAITRQRDTSLNAIIDVPLGFFTVAGISLGIFNAIMRPVNRQVLEERAWQARLDDARSVALKQDPTLTELDLIREEAEAVVGPYGPDAMQRRAAARRRGRVMVMDREDEEEDEYGDRRRRGSRRGRDRSSSSYEEEEKGGYVPMTDEEIDDFEDEFGVEYDPYYDEPYEEDELPTDVKCYTDGMFLDRRYENGEVFYYDEDIDMYWRQGCKPRIKKMFGF